MIPYTQLRIQRRPFAENERSLLLNRKPINQKLKIKLPLKARQNQVHFSQCQTFAQTALASDTERLKSILFIR